MRAWRGRTPRPRATTGLWSTTRLGKSHPRPSPRPPRRGESPGPCLKLASSWTTVPALPPARRPRRDEARRPSPPAARATRRSTRTTSSKRRCDPPRARAPAAEAAAADAEAARREEGQEEAGQAPSDRPGGARSGGGKPGDENGDAASPRVAARGGDGVGGDARRLRRCRRLQRRRLLAGGLAEESRAQRGRAAHHGRGGASRAPSRGRARRDARRRVETPGTDERVGAVARRAPGAERVVRAGTARDRGRSPSSRTGAERRRPRKRRPRKRRPRRPTT